MHAVRTDRSTSGRTRPDVAEGLRISGLGKSYGDRLVLDGVDLTVPAASITAILGASGSGKTTLLRLVAGFIRADTGTITIEERVVDGPDRYVAASDRGIGYVPQEGNLFPHLDVKANVGFGLRRRRPGRVSELLQTTGLTELADRYPHQLSGGQQQRVALARALATRPSVVLMDEPFSSLDAGLRSSIRLDVARILADAGTTTILVTHDQDEALAMADQVAVLRDGRVVQADHPEAIYNQPRDPDLAHFLGEANIVSGVIRGSRVETAFGRLPISSPPPVSDGSSVSVLLRPEQIEVVPPGSGAVTAVVADYEYHGHDAVITVAPDQSSLPEHLLVRMVGGGASARGTVVGLRASGPVTAWPFPALR